MNTLLIVIVTLLVYWTISTILFIVTNENDDVTLYLGIGLVGAAVIGFCWVVKKIIRWKKYHNKRSIILVEDTGEHKWCKLKDTNDIYAWHKGYKLIKRYEEKKVGLNYRHLIKILLKIVKEIVIGAIMMVKNVVEMEDIFVKTLIPLRSLNQS